MHDRGWNKMKKTRNEEKLISWNPSSNWYSEFTYNFTDSANARRGRQTDRYLNVQRGAAELAEFNFPLVSKEINFLAIKNPRAALNMQLQTSPWVDLKPTTEAHTIRRRVGGVIRSGTSRQWLLLRICDKEYYRGPRAETSLLCAV